MRNLLVVLGYDGSSYHGWQIQKNALTVQEIFQNAVKKVFHADIDIKGCSRTDSGVHAVKYCVSFKTDNKIKCENVVLALNTYLPKNISVFDCREMPCDFHARYSVKSKRYIYKIYNGRIRNPFYEKYAYHYKFPIDAEYLNRESKAFVGTYDFSAFCSSRSQVENTVRTVEDFSVTRKGDFVYFSVCADGFLYNMVRIMVGTLLFINEGKIESGALKQIIMAAKRKNAGKTAPPQGLYLNDVN
ncbi:MAG: tRNA pseudouridine(38-40) synthase TruA, partial [Clostridiales bacterium]|nr:tRNA pseudouridine(38-40) synthase TruA [Clostridiales bacterium]